MTGEKFKIVMSKIAKKSSFKTLLWDSSESIELVV
jgi:hypothetical protein